MEFFKDTTPLPAAFQKRVETATSEFQLQPDWGELITIVDLVKGLKPDE